MELKEQNETRDGNIVFGIIGGVIGGIIATLPWILMYVYGNMMWSFLGLIIGLGVFKGYEICKGKMDKKVPYIVAIISIICITIATLYVIPQLLLIKELGRTSMEALKYMYSLSEFRGAIIQDYIYSLLFTVLGISGIVSSIKRSIARGDEKVNWNLPAYAPKDEEIDEIKKIFKDRNAMDKDHTIEKKELLNLLKGEYKTLRFLTARGIIVSKKGGYFYSEANETNPMIRSFKIIGITFAITFGIIILIALFC